MEPMTMALLAAGSNFAQSLMGGNEQAEQAARISIAKNEAIVQANLANTLRTGYRVGLLQMQKGLMRQRAAQQGFDLTNSAQQSLGQVAASNAATGAVGASADAVLNDVRMKLGETKARMDEDWQVQLQNYNTQLAEIVFQGNSAVQQAIEVDIPSSDEIFNNALMSAAVSFGSSYATSKMSLGLGQTPPATVSIPSTLGNMSQFSSQGGLGLGFDLGSGLKF